MTDDARVPVTVEDREAAWEFRAQCYGAGDQSGWMAGKYDHNRAIQAFARHRLAGVAAGREEAAKLCDELADTAAMIQCAVELAGSEAPTKAAQREAAETLAAAIRQMGGE